MPINRSTVNYTKIQKSFKEYNSPKYLSPKRLSSIALQYRCAIDTGGESFLEIGPGPNILHWLLISNGLYSITSDIDIQLSPTVVSALPLLAFKTGAVDVVLCFQVLEHLPFSMLSFSFMELSRVAKNYIIISLPDHTIKLSIKDRLHNIYYNLFHCPSHWAPKKFIKHKEHFWEIGLDNVKYTKIIEIAANIGLQCTTHFRNKLDLQHHFFVFNKPF